jgi:hypothetical protein
MNRLKWVEQPAGTHTCGQVAVAVITGKSLDEVIDVIGHAHGSKTRELVAALKHFGYDAPLRCRKMEEPELGLAQVHRPNFNGWHWIVVANGFIYDGEWIDPHVGRAASRARYIREIGWYGQRITSYLPVTKT